MYNKHKMDKKKESIRTDHYTDKTRLIIRLTALVTPVVLTAYGFFVRFGIIQIEHAPVNILIGNLDLYIICSVFLAFGIWQFIYPPTTKFRIIIQLIAYHVLLAPFIICISGITSPFLILWTLLMFSAYSYYPKRGFMVSTVCLAITIMINVLLWQQPTIENFTYGIIAIIVIYYVSSIIIKTVESNEVERAELNTAKAKEILQRDQALTIINNLTNAVFSTDMDGIIRVYNAASLSLLDTNKSLDGHFIDEVLPLSDQKNNKISLFEEFKRLKTVVRRDDLNFTFGDGEEMRLEVTYSPIRSNFNQSAKNTTYDGFIVIFSDITKAKSLEEERDEFISVASHELRTPITIAEGTISNVQVMIDHPDITTAMLKDSINVAHDQIMFLANMVNDLSALSRAERTTEEDEEDIDVKELAHKMIDKYSDDAKAKKLHLNLDLAPTVKTIHVNRLYIEELLQNLFTNAIKYTKKGSVSLIIERKPKKTKFSVKDTGIGISKSDQTKIFAKFYRSEDYRTRETGGTGLGLYVSAKLAQKLGTKISLISRLNLGSTFSFIIKDKEIEQIK